MRSKSCVTESRSAFRDRLLLMELRRPPRSSSAVWHGCNAAASSGAAVMVSAAVRDTTAGGGLTEREAERGDRLRHPVDLRGAAPPCCC